MRTKFQIPDGSIRLKLKLCDGHVDVGLHQVLWELVPHGLMPLALYRVFASGETLAAVVLHGTPAKFLVHFCEPKHHLISVHIP